MILSEYKAAFYTFSGKLSDINRQIAFAGIAVIWIFKDGQAPDFQINPELILPAIFLVSALAADIFQYVYQSIAWAIFHRKHEKKADDGEDPDILAPPWMNIIPWIFFATKVLLVLAAYTLIIRHLWIDFSPTETPTP